MTQTRIYDFGALLTQGRAKTLTSSLFTPGIYEGFVPTVISSTMVEFSPGTLLLPNGMLIRESTVTTVTVPTPGSAENYTITVDHDDVQAVGGSAAYYTLQSGILDREQDPNPSSLALLWVRHAGGGPLTASMLSRPPTLQAGTLLSAIEDGFIPTPFPQACDIVKGSNIVATHKSRTVQTGSAAATLAAAGGGLITVTGLVGMTTASVGRHLVLTGAGTSTNNGSFPIMSYVSPTSVVISDNATAPGSDTASWREDEPWNLGLQVVNTAVSGLQTYSFRLPLPTRPQPKQIEVFASIPSLGSVGFGTTPYLLFDADGDVVTTTPTLVSGPVIAIDPRSTPAGTIVLASYDASIAPVSLGVTLVVPPATAGIFLKGYNLVGD